MAIPCVWSSRKNFPINTLQQRGLRSNKIIPFLVIKLVCCQIGGQNWMKRIVNLVGSICTTRGEFLSWWIFLLTCFPFARVRPIRVEMHDDNVWYAFALKVLMQARPAASKRRKQDKQRHFLRCLVKTDASCNTQSFVWQWFVYTSTGHDIQNIYTPCINCRQIVCPALRTGVLFQLIHLLRFLRQWVNKISCFYHNCTVACQKTSLLPGYRKYSYLQYNILIVSNCCGSVGGDRIACLPFLTSK